MTSWSAKDIPSLSGTFAVVTGGNSGLGFETSLQLALKGATVVVAARNEQRGTEAVADIKQRVSDAQKNGLEDQSAVADRVVYLPLDLADLDSVKAFADAVAARTDHVDLLFNNVRLSCGPQTTGVHGWREE